MPVALHPVEEAAVPGDVVVLQVDQLDLGVPIGEVVLRPVRLDQLVLDHPVDLTVQLQRVVLECGHAVLPHLERPLLERRQALGVRVAQRAVEVLALDVEGAHLAAVGQADRPPAGHVVADLRGSPGSGSPASCPAARPRVLEHPQQDRRRADLQEGGVLAHVRVAHDHVEAAVPLGVGVRLVAGVDDRPAAGGCRRHAFPDVLGPLGQEYTAPRAVWRTLPAPA